MSTARVDSLFFGLRRDSEHMVGVAGKWVILVTGYKQLGRGEALQCCVTKLHVLKRNRSGNGHHSIKLLSSCFFETNEPTQTGAHERNPRHMVGVYEGYGGAQIPQPLLWEAIGRTHLGAIGIAEDQIAQGSKLSGHRNPGERLVIALVGENDRPRPLPVQGA